MMEPIRALRIVAPLGVCSMPLWLEILINLIGYAGFVAIAMYHKPGKDERSDQV